MPYLLSAYCVSKYFTYMILLDTLIKEENKA